MNKTFILTGLCALLIAAATACAQTSAFTYQGRLHSATGAVSGLYDFGFNLYATKSGGLALTAANEFLEVPVTGGVFTVTLDFGNQFPGADRWLGIAVRTNGAGAFVTLAPRQPLTPAPYAIRSVSAGTAATAATATTASSVAAGAVNGLALAGNAVDSSKIADGSIAAGDLSSALLSNTFWRLTGNAGTILGANFLGTIDNQAVEVKVNNVRAWRVEPSAGTPNLIGGSSHNFVTPGVVGATIGGGGVAGFSNRVTATYGAVAGGLGNAVLGNDSFIGGGIGNTVQNAADRAVLGGGRDNVIGTNADNSTIPGGADNTVGNDAQYAFAAGRRAKANHSGAFVWADSTGVDFASTGANQFLVRASGGVGIGTTPPLAQLDVSSTGGDAFPQMRIDHASGNDYARLRFTQRGNYGHRWDLGALSNSIVLYSGYFGREFLHGDSNGVSFGNNHVGIGTATPQEKLHVAARWLRVDGLGDERAYLGGDGIGGEVQVGSLNPAINNVTLWNAGNNTAMDLLAGRITANQFNGPLNGSLSGTFSGGVSASSFKLENSSAPGSVLAARDGSGNAGWSDLIHQPVSRGTLLNLVGSINLRSGASVNSISPGVIGATLLGGGRVPLAFGPGTPAPWPNSVNADYATVVGGASNVASGAFSFVASGFRNNAEGIYSLAAGQRAKASHASTFVWADSQNVDFGSSTANEFSIRAAGGLRLDASTSIHFGEGRRQMLNLWNTDFGIGIQDFTLYFRSGDDFAWYKHGAHADGYADAGGGTEQMRLSSAGRLAVGGDFIVARGTGNEQGYIGGDGAGGNVQVGSLNSDIMTVELFNTFNGLMDLAARDASVRALTIRGGADLAEPFHMSDAAVPKGSLVVIDEENPGKLKLAEGAYDTRVAGIVSGANGVNAGITLHQEGLIEGGQNVALSGRVYALADAADGPIKPGDLLTSSRTPGHVMRVGDHARAQGAIVGKAMSALKEGKGMLLVLVTLQ